jgi:hypothetical protein
MKVFISWSGKRSHALANLLRGWLPLVIQEIEPYVSTEDIEKGARWSADVGRELETSHYGILCVTPENVNAPWLNFEAGALAKSFDSGLVSPLLYGMDIKDLTGPLVQFQVTLCQRRDISTLVRTINARCASPLPDGRLDKTLAVHWDGFEKELAEVDKSSDSNDQPRIQPKRSIDDLLEELVALVRTQQSVLSSPQQLIPQSYIREAVQAAELAPFMSKVTLEQLGVAIKIMRTSLVLAERDVPSDNPAAEHFRTLKEHFSNVDYLYAYLLHSRT